VSGWCVSDFDASLTHCQHTGAGGFLQNLPRPAQAAHRQHCSHQWRSSGWRHGPGSSSRHPPGSDQCAAGVQLCEAGAEPRWVAGECVCNVGCWELGVCVFSVGCVVCALLGVGCVSSAVCWCMLQCWALYVNTVFRPPSCRHGQHGPPAQHHQPPSCLQAAAHRGLDQCTGVYRIGRRTMLFMTVCMQGCTTYVCCKHIRTTD
jgi:hypothetical protein